MIKKVVTLLCMQLALCCTSFAANYLTFTAEEDSSAFSIEDHDIKSNIFYSLDNGKTWNKLTDQPVKLAKGDRALLKGTGPNQKPSWRNYSTFKMEGSIAASGSVMSLVDRNGEGETIPYAYCFYKLFENCTRLTQAPELPATTLAERCYARMYSECTSLTQAPELPATTLAEGCYEEMFWNCTNLKQAPELPATTLAESCYNAMFSRCYNLRQAPELPATTLARKCYWLIFNECTSLTQAPELPAKTLADGCYSFMFYKCSNLIKAPQLPATTLADDCYSDMFSGCRKLTKAPKLPATTLADYCYYGMFYACTSLTQAPELPATTLADYCYTYMFSGCTKLSRIKVAFTDWGTDTDSWVKDVAKNGTFICPKNLPTKYGEDFIPEGWKIVNEDFNK